MSSKQIRFSDLVTFIPKQLEAVRTADRHQYTLYGGCRGPGKSYLLRWYGVLLLLRYAQAGLGRVVGGLFCEDYPLLRDRQISKITTEFPDWLGELKDSKEFGLGFHMHEAYGGGVMVLRNLDDASKYKSAEFAFILVDELTQNAVETFNLLRGSLRWKGIERPRFMAASNPDGIGHGWVNQYWLDRDFPPELRRYADEFAFVKALPEDNPHLSPEYWEMLESLPPDLARAWRWGDWGVFEGQVFGELRRDIHGFTGDPPPGYNFCMMDYGEVAPCANYWGRVDQNGDVWLYRELYQTGLQYLPLKHRLKEMTVQPDGTPEEIRYTRASPDIFAKSRGTGVVGAHILNSDRPEYGGFRWPVGRADDNRIEGWRNMKLWVHAVRLHVHLENCPNWWRTVPTLVYDKHKTEDVDEHTEDHAAEATRYGLMSRPTPARRPPDEEAPRPGRSRVAIRARAEYGQPVETEEYV